MGKPQRILVLNAGSTSVKVAVFGGEPPRRFSAAADGNLVGGLLDRIGQTVGWDVVEAIGHRVVHGGDMHTRPCRVTDSLLADLDLLSPYDPTHMPLQIALMKAIARLRPGLPQVACFDTAFHSTLPDVARWLPLPRRLRGRGVRRFGFHGLSYQWLLREIERESGAAAARGRLVLVHLGGGASLAAVRDGRSIDTTMGFSPSGGIPMGTRSGDIDPGVVAFLARTEGMSAESFAQMAARESGLLGVSGTSGDVRLLTSQRQTDERAAEAIALFCYEIKKRIGSYAAALGGLDRLVFTGGIGENSADVRAQVCGGLEFLGVTIDPGRNAAHARVVSPADARVAVQVIPTDEEQMVADEVVHLLEEPEGKR